MRDPNKTSHHRSQNQPLALKTGQYPPTQKEHIANREQTVYSLRSSPVHRWWRPDGGGAGGRQQGCCRSANPRHKEGSMAQNALRVVEGGGMDKTKALDAALSQIERAFGKGSIMRLGKGGKPIEIEAISTGSLGLDIALGIGGLPRGRVVEIYGPESSGKTTLSLHVIAESQK